MTTPHVDFYYDYVCPYAYLAERGVARHTEGATLDYRPILLGGVFRSIGAPDVPMATMSEAKRAHGARDLQRWAARVGVPLRFPAEHPRRTVLALRATHAAPAEERRKITRALFDAYWSEGRDVADPAVVRAVLDACGLDGAACVARAELEETKSLLRAETDAAVARGVFGVPSFVVSRGGSEELFWGQDRLSFVERAIGGAAAPAPIIPPRAGAPRKARFYFDYSSPFAYLAFGQLEKLIADTGSEIELRPILLGALFRSIGTPDVPLFSMSAPKQAYLGRELTRFAEHHAIPFRFSSKFPMQTVKALRMTLWAPSAQRLELARALFRAMWAEDRDLADDAVLGEIAASVGLDAPSALASTKSDDMRAKLREETESAERAGVFGVPTFVIEDELFWGQDRIDLVRDALLADLP